MLETPLESTALLREKSVELANQQITTAEWGWMGGVIDGEGYISVNKVNTTEQKSRGYCFSPRLSVTNSDPAIIAQCADIFKRCGVGYYITEVSPKPNRRTCFTLRVDRMSHLKILLPLLIPHLVGEKKARARLVLEFVENRLKNGVNKRGQAQTNVPYDARILEIGTILGSWNLNDHTLSKDEMRASCLGRYGLDSEREPENAAETTASPAA